MNIKNNGENINVTFSPHEALFLIGGLIGIYAVYTGKEKDIPIQYSNRVITESGFERWEEAAEDFKLAQEEWKSNRQSLCERLLEGYRGKFNEPYTVDFTPEEKETFLALLNERRVFLSCKYELTEKDMNLETDNLPLNPRSEAITEVHGLGYLQASLLLDPS